MKRAIVIVSFLLGSVSLMSQTYSSDFEKRIISSFEKDSLNYDFFSSLFAIDSLSTVSIIKEYKNYIDLYISSFPTKKVKERKEKKRVFKIYKGIHDKFLVKYDTSTTFPDIFINGNYNCVTASALYAYVFDQLDIPYKVKESPSHVYLIAYPETLNIHVETTVPGEFGLFSISEKKIIEVVNELISYKLTTKSEVDQKGYLKFYEDYYFGKDFIPKSSLIGMGYYNLGVLQYKDNELSLSKNNLMKSKLFYSSHLADDIIKDITLNQLDKLQFNSDKDIVFLTQTLSDSLYTKDLSPSNIKYFLSKITDKSNQYIKESIPYFLEINHKETRELSLKYLYAYLARKEASYENSKEAIFFSDKLLELDPDSKIAKEMISYFCFRKANISSFGTKGLKEFEEMCDKYDFIKSHHRYNIALAYFYANISLNKYTSNKISEATSYRKKFENILDNNDLIEEVNKRLVVQLYLNAGNYYYYKEKLKNSYYIYQKGLSYVPRNSELIKKAKWSKEDM
ncbi:MAG: hypothetical protein HRT66_12935 [Flavobacteriaceae bacterium]|nr:hypothetical protein [Flavobacteriaceae bacterium]